MEERREIRSWHEVADPTDWTCEDKHGHEVFRRGNSESPHEMEEASYLKYRPNPLWMRSGSPRSRRGVGKDRRRP